LSVVLTVDLTVILAVVLAIVLRCAKFSAQPVLLVDQLTGCLLSW
jgi:hypothetical protein